MQHMQCIGCTLREVHTNWLTTTLEVNQKGLLSTQVHEVG